jgi:hypothetical protein
MVSICGPVILAPAFPAPIHPLFFCDLLNALCISLPSSASNRIIAAKDHASIQMNVAEVSWEPDGS